MIILYASLRLFFDKFFDFYKPCRNKSKSAMIKKRSNSMRSATAKKVVSIFSLIFGGLSIIGYITEGSQGQAMSWVISISMIVIGVLLLIPTLKKAEEALMIGALVLYSLFMFAGLVIMAIPDLGPFIGLLILGIVGVPFSFSIVYLARLAKEKNATPTGGPVIERVYPVNSSLAEANNGSIESQLISLKKMADQGLITEADYEAKKKSLLGLD